MELREVVGDSSCVLSKIFNSEVPVRPDIRSKTWYSLSVFVCALASVCDCV